MSATSARPPIDIPYTAGICDREVIPHGEGITVRHIHETGWRELAGVDPRGYQWGPPGTYVVAHDDDGRQLAEVKVNYAIDGRGCERNEDLIYLIEKAFTTFYTDYTGDHFPEEPPRPPIGDELHPLDP